MGAAIDAAVALGTLGLAATTFELARETRRSLDFESKPDLAAYLIKPPDEFEAYHTVVVVNMGRAPARNIQLQVVRDGKPPGWKASLPALAAGDRYEFSKDTQRMRLISDVGAYEVMGTFQNADMSRTFEVIVPSRDP